MSNLESWEDDPSAQDEHLARQTQNVNLNTQARSFQPGAQSFQPGAQSFQPGAQSFQPQYQQYGYNQYYQQQQQQQQQYGYNQYQQGYQGYAQPNMYDQNYQYQYQQQQQQKPQQQGQQQPQQQQRQFQPQIAKRPDPAPAANEPPKKADPPKAKVLSIGGDAAKPKEAPKAKVLSIGSTSKEEKKEEKKEDKKEDKKDSKAADAGAKVTAAKAIEKTGESKAAGTTSPAPSSGKSSPSGNDKPPQRKADTMEEQAEELDEETLAEIYGKESVNVIFIGHVDAGKSTLGGSILYATGMVDERTMDKYKREAKDAGRETWYLSWALDLTKEERAKGKTVEVGRGFFETDKRRYSILDAPGHKNFVPNMIGGASQADVGILVISARKGEYETGFEKGGQTREHAILAKTQGVNQLCVAVNKMDDPTVEWSQARYKECTTKLEQFLRGLGYGKNDVTYMPIAAQTTQNIKERLTKDVCPWYDGPSLLEYLDGLKTLDRKLSAPAMLPISAKYRDLGTMIEGKLEAGTLVKGGTYIIMPNRDEITIAALYGETEDEVDQVRSGEQVRARVKGVEEEDLTVGHVLCSPKRLVHCVNMFEAQIHLLELPSILSAGYSCVMHCHHLSEEVQFDA